MNDRIKEVRQYYNMSMRDFADKIGISHSAISLIESKKRDPGNRTIIDICKEFNVNEEWLRTGKGDMIKATDRNTELAVLIASMKNTPDSMRTKLTLLLQQVDDDTIALMYIALKEWLNLKNKDDPDE